MKRYIAMLLLYLMVCDYDHLNFQSKVNNALELGYKLQGNLCMVAPPSARYQDGPGIMWCQAMVKEDR